MEKIQSKKNVITAVIMTLLIVACIVCGFFTYKYFNLLNKTDNEDLTLTDVQIKRVLTTIADDLKVPTPTSGLSQSAFGEELSLYDASSTTSKIGINTNLYKNITGEIIDDIYGTDATSAINQMFSLYRYLILAAKNQVLEGILDGQIYNVYDTSSDIFAPVDIEFNKTKIVGWGINHATSDGKLDIKLYIDDAGWIRNACINIKIDYDLANDDYTVDFYFCDSLSVSQTLDRYTYLHLEREYDGNLYGRNFSNISLIQTTSSITGSSYDNESVCKILDADLKNKKVFGRNTDDANYWNYNPDFNIESINQSLFNNFLNNCKLRTSYEQLFSSKINAA